MSTDIVDREVIGSADEVISGRNAVILVRHWSLCPGVVTGLSVTRPPGTLNYAWTVHHGDMGPCTGVLTLIEVHSILKSAQPATGGRL